MSIRIQNTLNVPSNAVVEVNALILKRQPYSPSPSLFGQFKVPAVKDSELLGHCMSSFIAQMHQRVHPKKLVATRNRLLSCLIKQQSFSKLDRAHLKFTLSLLPSSDFVRLSARSLKTLELFVPEQRGRLQALRAQGYSQRGDEKGLLLQLTQERDCFKDLNFWLNLEEKVCLQLLNTRVSSVFLAEFLGLRGITVKQLGEFRVADFVFSSAVIDNIRTAAVIMGWSIKAQAALRLLKERRLDTIVTSVESKGLTRSWQELRTMVRSELSRPGVFRSRDQVRNLYLPLLRCFNEDLSRIDRQLQKKVSSNRYIRDIEDSIAGASIKETLKQLFLIGDIFKSLFPFGPDIKRLRFIARKFEEQQVGFK